MYLSRLISKTLRSEPTEAETISHRIMLKAGMIQQVASGVYNYLPLAWRSLRKIESIIREEMELAGGQEVRLSVLQPRELWEQTDRASAFGDNLFGLQDRRGRLLVMAPTHEETITNVARANIQSYRDLPVILYQIQTKFRDEMRPRGGLIRVREFDMKDAYSFSADEHSLDQTYSIMALAYKNIYRRCGLPALQVEADSGAIGGKDSHEFILIADSGEDIVLTCGNCGYAANSEKATGIIHSGSNEPALPLKEVSTPGVRTIDDVSSFFGVPSTYILKTLVYRSHGNNIMVTIRGDLEVNEIKLKNLLKDVDLKLATDKEVTLSGLNPGSVSALGITNIMRIGDESIKSGANFIMGSNRYDTHICNANYPRDFDIDIIADVALAQSGHLCGRCSKPLEAKRGIEVGHIFKLGTFFSEKLAANYLDDKGKSRPIIMGCYGIGIGRLLAAAIEQNHDDKGAVFPVPIAPYQVHLVGLNVSDPEIGKVAQTIYERLWALNIETLYDDRQNETAGSKFNDADLLGLPLRLVVSKRTLQNNSIEVQKRSDAQSIFIPLDDLEGEIAKLLA